MQFLWKYIDDLVGKGLDIVTLGERTEQFVVVEPGELTEPNNQENSENSQSSSSGFSFLGNLASSSSSETQSNDYIPASDERTEKRKKLAKRLIDMTTKIEDLSNQIYHLQQRVEVLERKSGVGY